MTFLSEEQYAQIDEAKLVALGRRRVRLQFEFYDCSAWKKYITYGPADLWKVHAIDEIVSNSMPGCGVLLPEPKRVRDYVPTDDYIIESWTGQRRPVGFVLGPWRDEPQYCETGNLCKECFYGGRRTEFLQWIYKETKAKA